MSDSGSEDHWPDDASGIIHGVAVAAPGYDSHNGLRSHTYISPKTVAASPKPSAPAQPSYNPQVVYLSQPQPQMVAYQPYPQYAYGPPQTVAYQVPAYYQPTYPVAYAPQPNMSAPDVHVYQPAYVGATAGVQGNVWVGRTKAEVEEDNMKIAKKEGAYDKRKVMPTGVKDDQMMWCVEVDGTQTLRQAPTSPSVYESNADMCDSTFVSMKELEGEWKKDPRFEDAYYFVREEQKKTEKKED